MKRSFRKSGEHRFFLASPRCPDTHCLQDDHAGWTRNYIENGWDLVFSCVLFGRDPHEFFS